MSAWQLSWIKPFMAWKHPTCLGATCHSSVLWSVWRAHIWAPAAVMGTKIFSPFSIQNSNKGFSPFIWVLCFIFIGCLSFPAELESALKKTSSIKRGRSGTNQLLLYLFWTNRSKMLSAAFLLVCCFSSLPRSASSSVSWGGLGPRRTSSMCSDAWPFPRGPWLVVHQSNRGRAGEGMCWRWEGRNGEAREQNTKFHLFWVGWLFFLAWREQLWIQFLSLANCVPESPGGLEKWQKAEKLYSVRSEPDWPVWDWTLFGSKGSTTQDMGHRVNFQKIKFIFQFCFTLIYL